MISATLVAGACCVIAGSATAQDCFVDQANEGLTSSSAGVGPGPGLPDNYTRAQTFLVDRDGTLQGVEVFLSRTPNRLDGTLVADIRRATPNQPPRPDSHVLASVTLKDVEGGGATKLNFSFAEIPVQRGEWSGLLEDRPRSTLEGKRQHRPLLPQHHLPGSCLRRRNDLGPGQVQLPLAPAARAYIRR